MGTALPHYDQHKIEKINLFLCRPLLDELWQRRDAAFVVVWDYARLARDMTQLNDVIRRIHGCGAEVATLTGIRAAQRYVEAQHNTEQEG
jgi:hypothetical protein